jgi:putative ABC transport system permease protein
LKKVGLVNLLVRKYLKFDKTQPFISITAILAFVGVMVGVMVLIIAMAIMNGFDKEFEKKLFVMNYPITIYPKGNFKLNDELLAKLESKFTDMKFSPYISTQGIAKKGESIMGAQVYGVDFDKEKHVNEIVKEAIEKHNVEKFGALLGSELQDRLYLSSGEKFTLIFTKLTPGGFSVMPTIKRFEADGSFRSGLIAYDKSYVFVRMEDLGKVLNIKEDEFDGVHVYSEKPMEDIKDLREFLPPLVGAVGWWQQNGNFFAALKMEKRALFIVLMLIILIASLNIISSLLMTVMNRRRDIALLLSLGLSKKELKSVFFRVGFIIGFGGIVGGVVLGLFGLYMLDTFPIVSLPADVYGTAKLPLDLSISDFLYIVAGSFVVVLLSSIYPAKKAADIDVLSVLRNE